MDFRHFKKLATVSAVALTVALGVTTDAQAQTTAQLGATFATAAGLASAFVANLDFGTWFVAHQGADTPTIAVTATAGVPPLPVVGTPGTSTVVNTVPPAQSGQVTVTSPIAGTVVVFGTIVQDFTSPILTLSALTYEDTVVNNAALPAVAGADVVTVLTGGVAEPVYIGGTLTISGQPGASTTFNDADIDVTFQY
jgi:hypothetical protein